MNTGLQEKIRGGTHHPGFFLFSRLHNHGKYYFLDMNKEKE